MPSQINPSTINTNFPVAGVNNNTQGFRSNELATQNNFVIAERELNDLMNKVVVTAPLTYGGNANINVMNGQSLTNMVISDFAYQTVNQGTITASGTQIFDFEQGYYQEITLNGNPATSTVQIANYPNIGYSEMIIAANVQSATHSLSFNGIGNIIVGVGIPGFNSVTNVTSFTSTGTYIFKLGSPDGNNWILTEDSVTSVIKTYTPTSSIGVSGDTIGTVAYDANFIYVCKANYNGTTAIWLRAALSTF